MATTEGTYDVVIAGSGAAGMTAALNAARLGLSTVVIEKTGFFGGSTARSGGGIWVPGNEVLRRAGVRDTAELATRYLVYFSRGSYVNPERQRDFLEQAP